MSHSVRYKIQAVVGLVLLGMGLLFQNGMIFGLPGFLLIVFLPNRP